MEEEICCVYNCDNEHLSGSTNRCIFSMWISRHRLFKTLPRVLHSSLLLQGHRHFAPLNMKLNKANCDWLFDSCCNRSYSIRLERDSNWGLYRGRRAL